MSKYKVVIQTIRGEEHEYVLCPRCEVLIPKKDFNMDTGEHSSCEEYRKSLKSRKRAEKKVMKMLNRLVR